jgi:hypothetical protein
MQLLFSFDQGMRVEKTLMQTLASQLSSTLVWPEFNFTLADIHYRRIIRKTHQPSFGKKSFSGKSSGYKHSKHDHPSRRAIRVSQHNVVHSDLSVRVCVLDELSGKHQKRFVPRTNTSIHRVILAIVRQDSLACVYTKTVDIKTIFITVISLKFSKETATHPSAVLVESL